MVSLTIDELLKNRKERYLQQVDSLLEAVKDEGRQRLANNLRRYIAPSVALKLLAENKLHLLTQEWAITHPATVMFVDIRDFVRTIRTLEHRHSGLSQSRNLIQAFFELTINIISEYEGTIGEFAGDRIMTVFGVPSEQPDHAQRAVQAAVEIIEAVEKRINISIGYNVRRLNVGVGINSGNQLYIGDIGSQWRRELVVIGTMVNIASRIEEMTKEPEIRAHEGYNILLSENTVQLLDGYAELSDLGQYTIRGYQEMDSDRDVQMNIYKLVRLDNRQPAVERVAQNNELRLLISEITEYIESYPERKRAEAYRNAMEQISTAWSSGVQLAVVLQQVMDIACELLDASNGTLWLLAGDKETLVPMVVVPSQIKNQVPTKKIGEGYVGAVAQLCEPILYINAPMEGQSDQHSEQDEQRTRYIVRSVLAVPILVRGTLRGVIQMLDDQVGKFRVENMNTLISIASETALALEKADLESLADQLRQEKALLEKSAHQLELAQRLRSDMLEHIRQSLISTVNPDDLLQQIMTGMVSAFNAEFATLYLIDWDRKELEFKVVIPQKSAENLPPKHPFAKGGIAVHVALSGESILIPRDEGIIRRDASYDQATAFRPRSILCVPVEARGKTIAVLQVMDLAPDKFNEVDLEVLKSLAATAGIAIENALEYQRRMAAEHLAAMNDMASNMVHHFNNEVGLIPRNIKRIKQQLAGWELKDDDQQRQLIERLDTIAAAARNALNYVKMINEPFQSDRSPMRVEQCVKNGIAQAKLSSEVIVEENYEAGLPEVMASSKLEIVFRNLIKNAHEAMCAQPKPNGEKWVRIQCEADGLGMVRVIVEDNGPGIPTETQAKLFRQPTSSTKGEDSLGFGLFWAHFYVGSIGGSLNIDPQYTDGARFILTLQSAKET